MAEAWTGRNLAIFSNGVSKANVESHLCVGIFSGSVLGASA